MKKELSCKTGLKKNIINKCIYEREIALCKKLSKEGNGRCGWGECDKCGVLPLLYKLHKGKLLEDVKDIKDIRKKLL